jgi:hypothetical protein
MECSPNPGLIQPGAWTSVSTPLGVHQKINAPMGIPKPWIQNPGSKTLANHNKHHQTNDDGTTWALAIPRRGYFPQPGVVAHATTPGGRPHRAPIVKGLLSTPAITFAVHRYSGPRVERNRFQGSGAVGDRVPRVAAGGTTRG